MSLFCQFPFNPQQETLRSLRKHYCSHYLIIYKTACQVISKACTLWRLVRIQRWREANWLIWCLPAAQVRGQVPPLNHRLPEQLWTWRWSTSPSCGKCLQTRLQPSPRDSNCFSAFLGWMERIRWHFLPLVKPHPLDSLHHPSPRGSDSYDPAYTGGTLNRTHASTSADAD